MLKFEKENGRYYYILVQKDMFDDQTIIVFRGGKNQHIKRTVFSDNQGITTEMIRLCQRRIKRGYTLVT